MSERESRGLRPLGNDHESKERGQERPPCVSVVDKGNLANPLHEFFVEPQRSGRGASVRVTKEVFKRANEIDAHEFGPASIAAADIVGYVESGMLSKTYVDMVRTSGLGDRNARVSGEAELVAYAKDGGVSDSPRRTARYGLTVSFPADSEKGRREWKFDLRSVDASRDPRARERAKVMFDAVAQYIDDGYAEIHLQEFVYELQEMMRRGIFAKDAKVGVLRLGHLLKIARRESNDRRQWMEIDAQIDDIRRTIAERDEVAKQESDADELALDIIDEQIKDAKGDMVESLKLWEERARIERWMHERKKYRERKE